MFFRRDYSRLWQPPPLPPGRLPWVPLLLVAGVFLSAVLIDMGG